MAAKQWQLFGFMSALRDWMRYDPPPGALLVKVAEFGAQLEADPVHAAELEHANLFFRVMPGTEHDGRIVSVTFTVTSTDEVHCQDIVCVPYPAMQLIPPWPPVRHHRT